ncbi:unnamed protein product [Vitrella brassicaformis CCMP3155]|uniref:Uncharacterized protein n=1 Tax=Vitrella brassicaformis (strain CCMP3155) TaxID=1169540 RepID=A0A0G4E8C4_VITBC|nr:unnamed protein product [Vitrella brassicaformis CCMP3155]|eukprot:CEL91674.1 unnamed protein product [Vitrella brassicaformis CCMP3155]
MASSASEQPQAPSHVVPVTFKEDAGYCAPRMEPGDAVALIIGGKVLKMARPTGIDVARQHTWTLSAAVPTGDHVYCYAIVGPDGRIKQREKKRARRQYSGFGLGGGSMICSTSQEGRSVCVDADTLFVVVSDSGWDPMPSSRYTTVWHAQDTSQVSSSSVWSSPQPPAPFTALTTTQSPPAPWPDQVQIRRFDHNASAFGRNPRDSATTIAFNGASQATRQLAKSIVCGDIKAAAARCMIQQYGADPKVITATNGGAARTLIDLVAEYHGGNDTDDLVRLLLAAGCPAAVDGQCAIALSRAAKKGDWDLVEAMLVPQHAAAVGGQKLLHAVAQAGGYDNDRRVFRPLQPQGVLSVIKSIADRDASVLTEVEDGMQPIHRFCQHPLTDPECQELLIDFFVAKLGRDVVNVVDGEGKRPLWHAYLDEMNTIQQNYSTTVTRLLHHGAQHLDTPNSDGVTLLRKLAGSTDATKDVLVRLLERGASVSAAGLVPPRHGRRLQTLPGVCGYRPDRPYDDERSDDSETAEKTLIAAYSHFLNKSIPQLAMDAINKALEPSRGIMASLTQRIPFRTEPTILPPDALVCINKKNPTKDSSPPPIPIGDSPIGGRINTAVGRYVAEAARIICTPSEEMEKQPETAHPSQQGRGVPLRP